MKKIERRGGWLMTLELIGDRGPCGSYGAEVRRAEEHHVADVPRPVAGAVRMKGWRVI